MATIIKRGPVWQAKVRRKGHPPYTSTHDSKAAAEAWAASVERDLGHGTSPTAAVSAGLTLGDALTRYRDEITPSKKGADQEGYRIKRWLAHPYAQRPLASLRGLDFAHYRDNRLSQVAPATVRLELALISNVYTRCAKEWGLEGLPNPIMATVLPRPDKGRERRLRPGEEGLLLDAAAKVDPRLPAVIVWSLETAMRRGETARLAYDDIDTLNRTALVREPKNGETRTVPLSTRAIACLPPRTGLKAFGVEDRWISHAFRRATALAGIDDLHLHDLRHEATSRFFELGVFNVIEIAMITGHKDLAMLRRYAHLNARQLAARLG